MQRVGVSAHHHLCGQNEEYLAWAVLQKQCPLCTVSPSALNHLQQKHLQFGLVLDNTGKSFLLVYDGCAL